MNCSLVVLLLTLGIAAPSSTVPRPNATAPPASAELPHSLSIGGPFSVTIKRSTASPDEERALAAAEAEYPPRVDVVKAMEAAHFKLDAVPSDTRLWWSSAFDGVRIAYAITADTVRYYLNLSEAFRQNRFKEVGALEMQRSSLSYSASVTRTASITVGGRDFHDVYVVKMSLTWSASCGSLCAMAFEKSREVVVNLAGTVLAVSGDGSPGVEVSWYRCAAERDRAA